MGITVLSSATTSKALPPASSTASADASPAEFASLLGAQISTALAGSLPSRQDELAAAQDTALDPEQLAALAALNPSLASQILATTAQASQNALPATVDRNTLDFTDPQPRLTTLTPEDLAGTPLLHNPGQGSAQADGRFGPAAELTRNLAAALASATPRSSSESLISASLSASKADITPSTLAESANFAADLSSALANTQSLPPPGATSTLQGRNNAAEQASPTINTPLQDNRWAQDFGEKIVWLTKSEQQTAQININPPQLGPIQINLSLNGDQANVTFTSQHAEVRQAIDDALPRLREMLSTSGIQLGDANVGAQLPQPGRDNASQFANGTPNGTRFSDENAILGGESQVSSQTVSLAIQRGRGMVDLFA